MVDNVIGIFIIYIAFGLFSTGINRSFRKAGGLKGSLLEDCIGGFGLVSAVAGLIALVMYGISLTNG